MKDLTSKNFKGWIPYEITTKRYYGSIVWKCKCLNCNRTNAFNSSTLHNLSMKQCNCLKIKSFIGKKFNRLTIINKTDKKKNNNYLWECICECGNKTFLPLSRITCGYTKSCGCLRSDTYISLCRTRSGKNNSNYKHGKSRTKEYLEKIKRNTYLKSNYNISSDEYQMMIEEQKNRCFICGNKETSMFRKTLRRLCVDHNHITNKIRKLLCQRCNLVLGIINEDILLLNKIKKYLEEHND